MYYADGSPEEEFKYPLAYDRVLRVARPLSREVAYQTLHQKAKSEGLVPVGHIYYGSRYWCLRVKEK